MVLVSVLDAAPSTGFAGFNTFLQVLIWTSSVLDPDMFQGKVTFLVTRKLACSVFWR
jgi:hypothetical protein